LKASGLAEAQELVVNEAIINGVEFVDVVDDVCGLFLIRKIFWMLLLYPRKRN
jgi:hypothetical protein